MLGSSVQTQLFSSQLYLIEQYLHFIFCLLLTNIVNQILNVNGELCGYEAFLEKHSVNISQQEFDMVIKSNQHLIV